MKPLEFQKICEEAYGRACNGHAFNVDELRSFGQTAPRIACAMAAQNHFLPFDALLELGFTSAQPFSRELFRLMAAAGCGFTADQILILGDTPHGLWNRTLSIEVAAAGGKPFTLDEILRLHNPADAFGATLAHWQAFHGMRFTVDDLLTLHNPAIHYAADTLYDLDLYQREYTIADISEEREYGQKINILHNGATVAHIMAREGQRFSQEEIARLGNPLDAGGMSIGDWMDRSAETGR
jgi:hypothetical protein